MKKNQPAILASLRKRKAMLLSRNNSNRKKESGRKKEKNFLKKRKQKPGGQKVETSPKHERETSNEQMPLNKFIAHCGVSSRRDAAEMVKLGKVKVNNEIITEPGHKVSAKDEIIVNGKKVFPRQKSCLYSSQ